MTLSHRCMVLPKKPARRRHQLEAGTSKYMVHAGDYDGGWTRVIITVAGERKYDVTQPSGHKRRYK